MENIVIIDQKSLTATLEPELIKNENNDFYLYNHDVSILIPTELTNSDELFVDLEVSYTVEFQIEKDLFGVDADGKRGIEIEEYEILSIEISEINWKFFNNENVKVSKIFLNSEIPNYEAIMRDIKNEIENILDNDTDLLL